MEKKYIVALSIGTSYSKAVVFDKKSNIVAVANKNISVFYPKPGWVEQDPLEIYETLKLLLEDVLRESKISENEIAGIGIANQRETTIIWDKNTGIPIYNAISWQCKRTAQICEDLKENAMEGYIKRKTGLRLDAYFSGPKIKWILDNVEGARKKSEKGDLLFGTINTWLLWKLTNGKLHITDHTNASRTMLYNIQDLKWDERILEELDIPLKILPEVRNSSEIYGYIKIGKEELPVASMIGDQQAGLFGQTCFNLGEAESTYGIGSFFLMNTKEHIVKSKKGLLTTIAFSQNGEIDYALEGSIFIAGGLIQWLKDELKIINKLDEIEDLVNEVKSSHGVYVVPSFFGLGAPYWSMYVKGAIIGLTYNVDRRHILRASLEAIGYQTRDLLEAIEEDTGIKIEELKVNIEEILSDGSLMQILSDILNIPIKTPKISDMISLGAAYSAGLAVGFWKNKDEIKKIFESSQEFKPNMSKEKAAEMYLGWKKTINMLLSYSLGFQK